ncbi:MAG TPA: hypothetical protein PLQ78_08660 [Flavipsychrobacter sp.]|nr:hypothetical protein [Flavipsychrobacter sp.]
MKHLLLIIAILFCIDNNVFAQGINNDPICGIWYDYDAAGQRIKRYYECKDPYNQEGQVRFPIGVNIFPNPTDGGVTGVTDETMDELSMTIYNIGGILVTSTSCTECNHLSLDISYQLQGTFVVRMFGTKQGYDNLDKSTTIIKTD